MKLKTIATIFKRFKYLRIWYIPNGEQWITNGVAVYSMEGMPTLTPAAVLKIFDIPEDKQAEWNCEVEPMPEDLCEICGDYRTKKIPLEPKETRVQYNGITYLLLNSENGNEIVSIDEKYIKPLYDDMEYLRYFKCNLTSGYAVILYDALSVKAVIMPVGLGSVLAKELLEIGKYFSSPAYCAVSENMTEHIPPRINADPETGEVLDTSSDYEQETLEGGADNNG